MQNIFLLLLKYESFLRVLLPVLCALKRAWGNSGLVCHDKVMGLKPLIVVYLWPRSPALQILESFGCQPTRLFFYFCAQLKQYLQVKTKNQAPYVSDWAKPTLGGYNYDVKFASATIA